MSTVLTLRSRSVAEARGRGSDPSRLAGIAQPRFAPLLEETELAGWSTHGPFSAGGYYDWQLLDDGRVLLSVAQVSTRSTDPRQNDALVAKAAQTAARAHALHTEDAGMLLQLAARTLAFADDDSRVSLAVALVDGVGGSVNLAIAGSCLAWRVRAARQEQLASDQPPIGEEAHFAYSAQEFALSLRERLVMVADNPAHRSARFAASIAARFASFDAESHRRMTATDALAIVQYRCEQETMADRRASASVVVARRR